MPVLARVMLAIVLLLPPSSGGAADAIEPRVILFSPQGTVKGVRQVTARFSEPMVPVGDPRIAADPFEVSCPEVGTARWADSSTWIWDFAKDPPAGMRCSFRLRAGLTTLNGRPFAQRQEFTFSTGGPTLRSSTPREGSESIDEDQVFVLVLDAEPTPASVLSHVSFAVEGLVERVGVRILSGRERTAILRARFGGQAPATALVIQARQRFANRAIVRLIWGKGIAAASGVESDQDQTLTFKVRDQFIVTFACERENPQANCNPVTPMTLRFSALVAWEQARQITLVGPGNRVFRPEDKERSKERTGRFTSQVVFKGPLPEAASFRIELPRDLRDDARRPLGNADRFPLAVKTDPFPPLAKFPARFGIVEAKANPALPVTLRNLEPEVQARMAGLPSGPSGLGEWMRARLLRIPPERGKEIWPWLRRLKAAGRESSIFGKADSAHPTRRVAIPKPGGAGAFEVVGIPLRERGLHIVEIESPRLGASLLGKAAPMYVPAGALVTNLSVHWKYGRENSLAWVTRLDDASPVPAAKVSVLDCRGTVLWEGVTDQQGLAHVAMALPDPFRAPRCEYAKGDPWSEHEAVGYLEGGLLITAQTLDDLSFVHSSWTRGIEPWRFQLPAPSYLGPVIVHTVLDRSLVRAGETASMKHVLREQRLRGLAVPGPGDRPGRLVIRHAGSEDKYELPLTWDQSGIAQSAWKIPQEAKLGRYELAMVLRRGEGESELRSGELRIEEFRIPLMKGILRPPGAPLVAAGQFPVDLAVQYLAGGSARNLPVTVRAQVRPRHAVTFKDFEGFTFANGGVKEGIVRRGVGGGEEDAGLEEEEAAPPGPGPKGKPIIHQREQLSLDVAGTGRVVIRNLPRQVVPTEVLTELEFRDPNGEVQTASTVVPVWPAQHLVGLQPDSWAASRDRMRVRAAVTTLAGRPVPGAAVKVEAFRRQFYSHRKRLVGGFYAFEHVEEITRVGDLCTGTTDGRGLLICESKPPAPGQLILQATATDPDGRNTAANATVWSVGSEDWWFDVADHDRIDLLPERRHYEPGETARFQLRMPFREATALVTLEREGVLEARVIRLSGREPVIEVPVKGEHAPNIFLSALVVRGRVGDVQPTALVDLGRPAVKLGVAEIRVGWRDHELTVGVTPERPVYKVRDKARVRVEVRTAADAPPPPGSEVALAAVDEGLLELLPNASWNLLEPMMQRRGYGIRTATAQLQVIGKRHFGLKALPQGGGGGRQTTRELFDTLLLWNGRVPLDAQGTATVEIPLNDSLTSFRIVAVATGGTALFGTGSASIRSTQDLMVLPGVAPLVREGDRFRAEVTLRNATERAMEVSVRGRVEGLTDLLAPQALTLGPGEARPVGWELLAPIGVSALRYEIEAGKPGEPGDRVRITQRVAAAVPVRTYQATLDQWEAPIRQLVQRPADALPGRGGVQVRLQPSLVQSLDGVRRWMGDYPYGCLEQKVSQAIALRDETRWRALAATLTSYLDGDGLLKYFPTMREGSDHLTAYVLAIVHEAGWSIADGARGRMEEALQKFVSGAIIRHGSLPTADLSIRKLAALEALSRHGKADPRLLGGIALEPNLWPTSTLLDWWNLLHRVKEIPERGKRLAEAEQIMRARLNFQGTTMGFSTEQRDGLWWLMVSSDVNAVRLILHLLESGQWRQEVPRLVRGALGRQRRGAWDLTVANAWGVLALEKFSGAFEKTPVRGISTATLAGRRERQDWAKTPRGATLDFAWPAQAEEIAVEHEGQGRPWVSLTSRAALPLALPLSSGFHIEKKLTPIEARTPGRWSRGDLVRVTLTVAAQSDMTWVVVSDPVPAGASHLGSGLATQSQLAQQGQQRSGWTWPAFEERSFEAFRAYYQYVPKGTFSVEYVIRLNLSGRFQLPTTRVEALYAPEMFGELPQATIEVEP